MPRPAPSPRLRSPRCGRRRSPARRPDALHPSRRSSRGLGSRAPAAVRAPAPTRRSQPMLVPRRTSRFAVALAATAAAALAAASAHARLSPAVSLSGDLQLYSLAVPTEKAGVETTSVVLTVPKGFSIDSFVPSPGWKRAEQSTGSGQEAVVQKVTWTGGHVPTDDDALFQFLGEASKPGTYAFRVQQTYSDGSIVDWSGPESSESPAPSVEARSSLGGAGGTSTLTIVALVLGALGLLLGVVSLLARSGRQLA